MTHVVAEHGGAEWEIHGGVCMLLQLQESESMARGVAESKVAPPGGSKWRRLMGAGQEHSVDLGEVSGDVTLTWRSSRQKGEWTVDVE
jgi:hypothetical protein